VHSPPQPKLKNSRLLIVGLSENGCIAARLLATLHVGTIGIVCNDLISESHAQKSTVFKKEDAGQPAGQAVLSHLQSEFSTIHFEHHDLNFNAHNAEELMSRYDLTLDALEDWQDKLLASDTAMRLGKPLIHSGIYGFNFQVFTMLPGKSACLRCMLSQRGMEDISGKNGACDLGIVSMAASLQVIEAVKILGHTGISPADELIHFDGLRREFSAVRDLNPRPDCPDCGRRR
jgi:molybdopterin-synthase adenylyltransferase